MTKPSSPKEAAFKALAPRWEHWVRQVENDYANLTSCWTPVWAEQWIALTGVSCIVPKHAQMLPHRTDDIELYNSILINAYRQGVQAEVGLALSEKWLTLLGCTAPS